MSATAEPEPEARLSVSGLRKAFGPTEALGGVTLRAAAGEVHAVVGENGAGKSTLMEILAGALRADAGTLSLDGEPYAPRSPLDARRLGVAMVHQELSLCPHLTVAENVLLGTEPTRAGIVDRRRMEREVGALLARFAGAATPLRPDALVRDLSPAAQQLVEIARALALPRCRVLLLDEPTSSLAAGDVERLFELLRALRAGGLTILYISHALEEVQAIADAFTVLRDGRTVGSGRMTASYRTSSKGLSEIVHLMVGRSVDQLFPRSPRTPGETALDVEDLSGREKPRGASLSLRRGEVLGIAGLVGAGRTELLRAVFGLDPVKSGRVRVGAFAGPASPWRRLAQGVGLVSEDRKGEGLALGLSVADNLTLSKLGGLGPAGLVLPGRKRRAAAGLIERLGVRCRDPDQPIRELSGGNEQKVALARLLYHEVDVLLLDEPTRGIDIGSKAQIYELIDALAASGKAILMVSSYLPELFGVSDRIAVMCRGALGPARPVGETDPHAVLMEATGA